MKRARGPTPGPRTAPRTQPHYGKAPPVDAVVIGAIGTMVVGAITGLASWHGQRSSARANHTGVVMTGYGGLVDNLQEERDKVRDERDQLQAQLTEKDAQLSAAYAELARERAEKAGLQAQIAELTTERQRLLDRMAALGGDTQ